MLKRSIKFKDWNDLERIEEHYFNLTKLEVTKMQASVDGGYDVKVKALAAGMNGAGIMEFFENFIRTSYGIKSDDGRRFMKSEEISRAFMETRAYEVLFEELVTNPKAAAEFFNAVMPQDLDEFVENIEKAQASTQSN
jgi:hypothetical protein